MAEETPKTWTIGELRKKYGVHGKESPIFRNKEGKASAPSSLEDILTHKAAQALHGHIYGKSLQSPAMPDPANPKGAWIPTPPRADTEDATKWHSNLGKNQAEFTAKHEKEQAAVSIRKTALAKATPAPQKAAQIALAAKLKTKQASQAVIGAHAIQQALPGEAEKEKTGVVDVPTITHAKAVSAEVGKSIEKGEPISRATAAEKIGLAPPRFSGSYAASSPPSSSEPRVTSTAFILGSQGVGGVGRAGSKIRGQSLGNRLKHHGFTGLKIPSVIPTILDPTKGVERPDLAKAAEKKQISITTGLTKAATKVSAPKGLRPGTVEYHPAEKTYADPARGAAGGYTKEFQADVDAMLTKAAGPPPKIVPKKKEESKNRYMNFVDAVLGMTVKVNRLYEKKYKKINKS